MSNPLDILFGPSVVRRLRNNPRALVRLAERIKPFLMAASHPDRTRELDSDEAARVSEAYQILSGASHDDMDQFVEFFLSGQSGREERLKLTIRELREAARKQEEIIAEKDRQIQAIGDRLSSVNSSLLSWLFSEYGVDQMLPVGSVARKEVHLYRILVRHEGRELFFSAFEFDEHGAVIHISKGPSREMVSGRISLKRSKSSSATDYDAGKAGYFLGTSVDRFLRDSFYRITLTSQNVEGVLGKIQPYIAVGRRLVLCHITHEGEFRVEPNGVIVSEIIPLQTGNASQL